MVSQGTEHQGEARSQLWKRSLPDRVKISSSDVTSTAKKRKLVVLDETVAYRSQIFDERAAPSVVTAKVVGRGSRDLCPAVVVRGFRFSTSPSFRPNIPQDLETIQAQ